LPSWNEPTPTGTPIWVMPTSEPHTTKVGIDRICVTVWWWVFHWASCQ
jgi:hypothetical protein